MELLQEYQVALKKIEALEAQIEDFKEAVKVAEAGFNIIHRHLGMAAQTFHAENDKERVIRDQLFIHPQRMLDMILKMLQVTFKSEEKKVKARKEIAIDIMKELRSKLDSIQNVIKE